ncbi:MAG TPA: hypothetical protein VGV15_20420 [Terriglobales bacterium]|nr:hypothetical protein [Terriglobales bacterium]
MKICTEADYLHAHLTVIERTSRITNPTLLTVKQQAMSMLGKWIFGKARPEGYQLPNRRLRENNRE